MVKNRISRHHPSEAFCNSKRIAVRDNNAVSGRQPKGALKTDGCIVGNRRSKKETVAFADAMWASEAQNADASGHLKQRKSNLKEHYSDGCVVGNLKEH